MTDSQAEGTPSLFPDHLVFSGTPRELHYFAYGSNMNKAQILSRCTRPVVIATAKLPEYCIGFYGYSKTWDGGVETLVEAPGQELWGVIYALNFSDGDSLDAWQDVRQDGTGAYFHYPVLVTDPEGNRHTVLLYKKDCLGPPRKPSQEYRDVIVQGAEEQGLPAWYIETLRRIEAKKAGFAVPLRASSGRKIFLTGCSECEGG